MLSLIDSVPPVSTLHCHSCGNDTRFDQLISFAVNYVTAAGHVIRQMDAEVSGYRCVECGEDIEAPLSWVVVPPERS